MSSRFFLINELGKTIAGSTVTGDFFEVPEALFEILTECRENGKASLEEALKSHGLEANDVEAILEAFPEKEGVDLLPKDRPGIGVSDLTLNLTSNCNLACVYCWNDRGSYSNSTFIRAESGEGCESRSQTAVGEEMSIETAHKAVDDLIHHRGNETELVVDFYGGEPLLNLPVMKETIRYCREREKDAPVHFRFLIATNGTLLTPEVAEELSGSGVEIAISIDGPAEIQNENRPFHDGAGSYDTVRRNLAGMSDDLRMVLVGRATVTPSHADMVNIYHALREIGFDRIELFESEDACHRITPGREAVFFHTQEQYERLCEEYDRLARLYIEEVRRGQLTRYNTFFNRFFKLMQKIYHHHEVTGGCPAGRGQLAVACDGTYYPCTAFIGVDEFAMGNVRDGLDEEKMKEFIRKADERDRNCGDCDYYALCRSTGSCLNLNLHYNGDMSKPWEYGCKLFRYKMDLAMAALTILTDECPELVDSLMGEDPSGARGSYPAGQAAEQAPSDRPDDSR